MKTSGVGMYSRLLSAAALVLYLSACSATSVSPPVSQDVRETAEEALTADILESEPAVTTSFSDAVTEVAFLDAYQPTAWKPLSVLPRTENNWFQLAPGRFAFVSQSYCLHAGTHAPSGGKGYLWASLEGPRAGIIRSILQRSVDHPEVPQRQIQALVWAVLARAQFNEMPPDRQAVAATLLTPEELAQLNGGALGLARDQVLERAAQDLPEPARAALRARAELRRRFLDAESTYEDLEEAAVLAGAAPEEDEIRHVPASRWSYHPDGYFVRYRPNGYKRLRIQLYVPDRFTLERNAARAITKIADPAGNRIEVEYADGEGAAPAGGSPASNGAEAAARGRRMKRVRFVRQKRMGPEIALTLTDGWTGVGWTLVGQQTEGAEIPAEATFPGIEARRRKAAAMEEEVARLERELGAGGTSGTRADVRDLGHLVLALRASLGERELSGWQADHLQMAEEAWMWTLCRHLGDCRTAGQRGQSSSAGREPGVGPRVPSLRTVLPVAAGVREQWAGPAASGWRLGKAEGAGSPARTLALPQQSPGGPDGGAMPANTSEQRLASSGRNGQEEPDEQTCEVVREELQETRTMLDAFENEKLLDEAQRKNLPTFGDDRSYQELVENHLEEQFGGQGKEAEVEAAMHTDCDCEIDKPPRSTYTDEKGYPSVIYDFHKFHEEVHEQNCLDDPHWCERMDKEPGENLKQRYRRLDAYQEEEKDAYEKEIENMENYLKRRCGGVR